MTPETIFTCNKCGDCCKGYGGTFVTPEDIRAIADFIQADPDHFVNDYCRMSGDRPLLRQGSGGYCVFWDTQCTIHPVKPRMCRAWPYIPGVLRDPANWRGMASVCPGMDPEAPDETIKKIVGRALSKTGPS